MAKQSRSKNLPESSNAAVVTNAIAASGATEVLLTLRATDFKCEAYAKCFMEMESTIREFVRKNQVMEDNFAYKIHVLEDKARELEDINTQLQAC